MRISRQYSGVGSKVLINHEQFYCLHGERLQCIITVETVLVLGVEHTVALVV